MCSAVLMWTGLVQHCLLWRWPCSTDFGVRVANGYPAFCIPMRHRWPHHAALPTHTSGHAYECTFSALQYVARPPVASKQNAVVKLAAGEAMNVMRSAISFNSPVRFMGILSVMYFT